MSKQLLGLGSVVGAVVALGAAVGCSDSFAGGDCHASRTCGSAAGERAAAPGSDGSKDTTVGGAGGGDDTTLGGSTAVGGAAVAGAAVAGPAGTGGAGGAVDAGCSADVECSNDDPVDGEEVCDKGACLVGNAPPTVVSFTPESDAVEVEPDTSVVIQFSEPLDPKTVTSTTIRVLDGTTVVPGEAVYADAKVTFTPSAPLALLAPYTLSVTTGVTDEAGAPLVTELSSTFSIRDGVWHKPTSVAKDSRGVLSDVLPMTSDGRVLLAWSGSSTSYCPAWGRWFQRGAATTAAKSFAVAGQTECNFVSSGGNAAGVSAVVWSEPDSAHGTDIVQYRGDAWQQAPVLVSKQANSFRLRLAVAPSGAVTFFEHQSSGSKTWTSDAAGKWPAEGNAVSTLSAGSRTSVSFDAKGKGLAVWLAKDSAGAQRILVSRLAAANGKWLEAEELDGSVAATSGPEQRGVPVVAMDASGDALALWVDASSTRKLMASRYLQATGWEAPEVISGAPVVDSVVEAPALAFDGQAFVAAWTAQDAGKRYTYSARYEPATGWAPYEKQQEAAADGTTVARMPRLVGDGRGNLLLVFATGTAPTYTLVSQRYSKAGWGKLQALPGGTVSNKNFEGDDILPLSMSANGLAALAWTNYDSVNYDRDVLLASFY